MILPADYKAPIKDEDEYEGSMYTSDPSDSEPSDYIPYSVSSPISAASSASSHSRSSSEQEPLLAGPEDLEWGPVPPYTPREPLSPQHEDRASTASASPVQSKRERRRRWIRLVGAGAVGYLAILGCLSLVYGQRIRARGGWPGRHGPPGGQGGDFQRERVSGESPAGVLSDGPQPGETIRQCVEYRDSDDWVSSPSTDGRVGLHWAKNQTFLLPTQANLFAHLSGDYPFGNVVMHTFDANGAEEPDAISAMKTVKPGEYAKVVVESRISAGQAEKASRVEETEGWRVLKASGVCLVDRAPQPHFPPNRLDRRHRNHARPPPAPQSPLIPGFSGPESATGLSIRTRRPDTVPASHPTAETTPLSFVMHVYLPRAAPREVSESSGLARLLRLRRRESSSPKEHIAGLSIGTGVGDIRVDLPTTSVGVLELHSGLGSIELGETRAASVKVMANGDVRGTVDISEVLDVATAVGNVELDVTLASSPSLPLPHPRGQGKSRPFFVFVKADTGSPSIRYTAWEDMRRPLESDIQAVVGDVTVESHAAFQGDFALSTTIGNIEAQEREVEDPRTGGGHRAIQTEKHGGVLGGMWKGTVTWIKGDSGADGAGRLRPKWRQPSDSRGSFRAKTTTGDVRVLW